MNKANQSSRNILHHIKPQPFLLRCHRYPVVLHSSSTSNHNTDEPSYKHFEVVLHSSSTSNHNCQFSHNAELMVVLYSSSTSNHNRMRCNLSYVLVVLYSSSTSNHNKCPPLQLQARLYFIHLLHQTTTHIVILTNRICCTLFIFYIKPQPSRQDGQEPRGCTLFIFYIKPQRRRSSFISITVVLYSSSTSNHNWIPLLWNSNTLYFIHLLHQTTTLACLMPDLTLVIYLDSK